VYAIVQARGRQLKVTPGAVVEIDGVPGEQGSTFEFEQVLLVQGDAGDIVAGAPFVANAKVLGVVDGAPRSACSRRSGARDSARRADIAASSRACASRIFRSEEGTPEGVRYGFKDGS
jgi:ribosomal protein L21